MRRNGAAALAAALLTASSSSAFSQASGAPTPSLTAPPAAEGARNYVDAFCLALAGGYVADEETALFLRQWDARPGPAAEAADARPVDAPAPGQRLVFADKAAPAAFLEVRRGVCSLIWPGASIPSEAVEALRTDKPPVGPNRTPIGWLPVTPRYGGAPPPPKFLLRQGGAEDRGVCAERRDDLRLRSGAPVSMLQLAPCRLSAAESVTP